MPVQLPPVPGCIATAIMDGLEHEPMIAGGDLVMAVVTMAALPSHVNMLETVVLPVAQPFLGRG